MTPKPLTLDDLHRLASRGGYKENEPLSRMNINEIITNAYNLGVTAAEETARENAKVLQ